MPFPFPRDEAGRLVALSDANIIDTEPEAFFDKIVRSAALACHTEMAFISMVDSKRQWIKASVNLDLTECARDKAFCAHTILSAKPLILPDARQDPRFSDNPFVTGEPHLRGYIGTPIMTKDGHALGALCVASIKSITPNTEQIDQLVLLADAVAEHLAVRRRAVPLHRAKSHLAQLIHRMPTAIAMFDEDLCYIAMSERWAQDYNLDRERAIGQCQYDLMPELTERERAINNRCLAGAVERSDDYELVRADGRTQHLRWEVAPWKDEYDTIGGLVMMTEDISAQKAAFQSKADSEARLARAMRLSGCASIEVDCRTNLMHCSDTIPDFIGKLPPKEARIQDFWLLTHPEDLPAVKRAWTNHWKGGPPMEVDHRLTHPDGTSFWVRSFAQIRRDEQGKPLRIVGMVRDISLQKQQELALAAARDAARSANEAKTEFLATVSHELRTPLHCITGFSELLNGSDNLTGPDRRHAQLISEASDQLQNLVSDILDLSSIEAKAIKLNSAEFDLREAAQTVVDLLRQHNGNSRVDLHFTASPDLAKVHVGDAFRFRQILTNLVGNALKFTESGSVDICMRPVNTHARHQRVLIEVTDTGIGIPTEEIANLFKRFYQVERSNRRQFGGAGLGLAICRGLIETMGGRIGADSLPEGGTRFWFEIELETPGKELNLLPREATQVDDLDRLSAACAGRRFLIADDVRLNHELVTAALAPLECQLDFVMDGEAAFQQVQTGSYDLVLMDIQMPGMDGLQATRHIRGLGGHYATMPIIAMTSNVLSSHIADYDAAGMTDYIGKPARQIDMYHVLARWFQSPKPEKSMLSDNRPALDVGTLNNHFIQEMRRELNEVEDYLCQPASSGTQRLSACAHRIAGVAPAFGHPDLAAQASFVESCITAGLSPEADDVVALRDNLRQIVRAKT